MSVLKAQETLIKRSFLLQPNLTHAMITKDSLQEMLEKLGIPLNKHQMLTVWRYCADAKKDASTLKLSIILKAILEFTE